MTESEYGYWTIPWDAGSILIDGTYEFKVETECDPLTGVPDDFNGFDTNPIIVVKDTTAPKLYGSPSPLRSTVIPGEEISITFTEKLLCTVPHVFDLKVSISGTGKITSRDSPPLLLE